MPRRPADGRLPVAAMARRTPAASSRAADPGSFPDPAARTGNAEGAAPVTLLCDHATNAIPSALAGLGLRPDDLETHVAYDPGAAALTQEIAERLDAAYVLGGYSRLLIDVNRDPEAPDSILVENDGIRVPGNRNLSAADRAARVDNIYTPYHARVDSLLTARLARQGAQLVVSVHSFTPTFAGRSRPWEIGVIFQDDRRLARWLAAELVGSGEDARLTLGLNQPYSPRDRVYHTLARHAEARGLPCAMVELPNDALADGDRRGTWADRLAQAVRASLPALAPDHA